MKQKIFQTIRFWAQARPVSKLDIKKKINKNFQKFSVFLTKILNKLFEEYDNELDYNCEGV